MSHAHITFPNQMAKEMVYFCCKQMISGLSNMCIAYRTCVAFRYL